MALRQNNRLQPTIEPQKQDPVVKSTQCAHNQTYTRLPTSQPACTKRKRLKQNSETKIDQPKGVRPINQLGQELRGKYYEAEAKTEAADAADKPERVRSREQFQKRPSQPWSAAAAAVEADELEDVPKFEQSQKRVRTNRQTARKARLGFWIEKIRWPTEEEERTMDRFKAVRQAIPQKKSKNFQSRKRSAATTSSEIIQTQTSSSGVSREEKSAPYKHPRYEDQLREKGSFMDDHDEGISKQSEQLLTEFLTKRREPPKDTLFSDDIIFKKICKDLRGENETKVIVRIAELIFPSAETLAYRGAEHLKILRETTNRPWTNALPFCGPRPQPDFGLGFKRDAFNPEQIQKLGPLIGDPVKDTSCIAVTHNMCLPFFTSEVKCGSSPLDIADRRNLHSQTVSLRNLANLFELAGRLHELHREVNGYSVSHSDSEVRIWAHYIYVNSENECTYHRRSVANFCFTPSLEGDQRWKAWNFTVNVFDYWVPKHFQRICSVIDMLPTDLDAKISNASRSRYLDSDLASSCSGLSRLADGEAALDDQNQNSSRPGSPNTTLAESSKRR